MAIENTAKWWKGLDLETAVKECKRLDEENDILWAIYKTCFNCSNCKQGIIYGCEIQRHIDLSGECNQRVSIR
jgi:hypothetical protein